MNMARRTNQNAACVVEMCSPPCDLDATAKKIWEAVSPWMTSTGPIERWVLARYCIATSLWMKAVDDIAKHGAIYTVRHGQTGRLSAVREMPAAAQVRSLEAVLRSCEESLRPYIVSASGLSSPPPLISRSSRRSSS